jgi:hypothetical protein
MKIMPDITDTGREIEGYSDTRERKYQTYIPEDTRIEGFCTFSELKERIERLEKVLAQVCDQLVTRK